MKKSIGIIGSAGIPARYGGFETLAEQLALGLSNEFFVIVACNYIYSKKDLNKFPGNIKRVFVRVKPNGIRSILYDLISIFKIAYRTNYILILGSSSAFFIPFLRIIFPKTKIIYHPDGLEWKRAKWNILAKLFLDSSSSIGAKFAHKIIIDNLSLQPYYNKYTEKIHTVSYGGDQYEKKEILARKNYWLTIARAEPENNLGAIADFFCERDSENWLIITNWKNTKYGRQFFKKYENISNINIIDSEYNTQRIAEYFAECKGYIHGHSCGGTNPTLVAAMWNKFPIICHDNPFNRSTTHNLALYFKSKADINKIINNENTFDTKLFDSIYAIAENEYSWQKIILQYKHLLNSM